MPCCHKCDKPFSDGEIGDVKNYPYDGLVAVFFKCSNCGEESQFIYEPFKEKKENGNTKKD